MMIELDTRRTDLIRMIHNELGKSVKDSVRTANKFSAITKSIMTENEGDVKLYDEI